VWYHNLTADPPSTSLVSFLQDNTTLLNGTTYICGSNYDGSLILIHTSAQNALPAGVAAVTPPSYNAMTKLQVYLKNTITGELKLVSVSAAGNETSNQVAYCAQKKESFSSPRVARALSSDGQWAVFTSGGTNLDILSRPSGHAPRAPQNFTLYLSPYEEVFVRNLVTDETQIVSRFPGRERFTSCYDASIAPNATRVTFVCAFANSTFGVKIFAVVACDFNTNYAIDPECLVISRNSSGSPSETISAYDSAPGTSLFAPLGKSLCLRFLCHRYLFEWSFHYLLRQPFGHHHR